MDFFERQDRARRKTWLLVFYLLLAVATISVLLNLVVYFLVVQGGYWVGEGASYLTRPGELAAGLGSWFTQPLSFAVTGTVMVTVLLGSGFKYLQLRGGGRAVAEMVGAREIDFTSHDPAERQLINVVEEMAIASGTPVPALFLLDEEPGINAFVAGYRPTEAVMVVTRGTVETLSRDELQGVVGHEFSHILNGDMRLNVRLMAILAGVLMLGVIGRFLLYGSFGHHRRRGYGVMSSGRGRSRSNAGVVILGIALLVLGYVGLFFGRLVKAAVSRQREFLADASSVQFTRNPDGIAGALWKIQQHQAGSLLSGRHAEDTSHMCFGESVTAGFIGWMRPTPRSMNVFTLSIPTSLPSEPGPNSRRAPRRRLRRPRPRARCLQWRRALPAASQTPAAMRRPSIRPPRRWSAVSARPAPSTWSMPTRCTRPFLRRCWHRPEPPRAPRTWCSR